MMVANGLVVLVAWVGRENYKPVITGSEAPAFSVMDLEGNQVSLSDFLGEKVLLVNVWATWCGPCLVEMPSFLKLRFSS